MNKKRCVCVFLLFMFLFSLVNCTSNNLVSSEEVANIGTLTPLILPTIQPRPNFVLNVSPEESQNLPLSLFEADMTKEYFEKTGILVEDSWGNPDTGYKNGICIEIELEEVAEIGDDFTQDKTIIERVEMKIDDKVLSEIVGFHSSLAAIKAINEEGNVIINGLGSAIVCGKVRLDIGIHKASFQFRQTSGYIQSYIWQFVIIDD